MIAKATAKEAGCTFINIEVCSEISKISVDLNM